MFRCGLERNREHVCCTSPVLSNSPLRVVIAVIAVGYGAALLWSNSSVRSSHERDFKFFPLGRWITFVKDSVITRELVRRCTGLLASARGSLPVLGRLEQPMAALLARYLCL